MYSLKTSSKLVDTVENVVMVMKSYGGSLVWWEKETKRPILVFTFLLIWNIILAKKEVTP